MREQRRGAAAAAVDLLFPELALPSHHGLRARLSAHLVHPLLHLLLLEPVAQLLNALHHRVLLARVLHPLLGKLLGDGDVRVVEDGEEDVDHHEEDEGEVHEEEEQRCQRVHALHRIVVELAEQVEEDGLEGLPLVDVLLHLLPKDLLARDGEAHHDEDHHAEEDGEVLDR
jgi:hypothetical protein